VYLVALGAVGNNFLDARSANNQGRSFLPVDHGLNVSVPIATCVGWVASGKRSALGPPIVLGCCALHPLLYLFLEDPVSDFIIKRREIGVELPATRKYFCPKMREPNLIFGPFKNPSRDAVNGVAALRQPRFSICVYSSVVSLKLTYLIRLLHFFPVHSVFARACAI
jgi:hypothetical protein